MTYDPENSQKRAWFKSTPRKVALWVAGVEAAKAPETRRDRLGTGVVTLRSPTPATLDLYFTQQFHRDPDRILARFFLLIFRQILNPFGVKALCKAKCYPNSMMFFPFEAQNREATAVAVRQASEHRLLGLPRRFALLGIKVDHLPNVVQLRKQSFQRYLQHRPVALAATSLTAEVSPYCDTNREPAA